MSKSAKTTCLDHLRLRILTLDIKPGTVLDETALSREYGLSRTPLREVFQRLAGDGYLTLEQNRGAKVASMSLDQMRTFFQTAPLIYATVSRLAAENRTATQLGALKDVQVQFVQSAETGNGDQAAMLNHRFHELIGEMAHNEYLTPSLNRMLIDHTRLGQTFYRPASDAEKRLVTLACQQHDRLIAAIETREPALAVELTLQHWDLSRDRLERFVRPDPLPLEIPLAKEKRHAL